jgi:hypothetical protein
VAVESTSICDLLKNVETGDIEEFFHKYLHDFVRLVHKGDLQEEYAVRRDQPARVLDTRCGISGQASGLAVLDSAHRGCGIERSPMHFIIIILTI